jgi:hypothetical protein
MATLGDLGQHVLRFLLPTEATAGLNGPSGEVRQNTHKATGVLAPLGESDEAAPRQGNHLGDGILFVMRTPEMPKIDMAMQFYAGQQSQKGELQVFRGGSGGIQR